MSSVVARLVQLTDDGDVARTFDVADKELVIGRYDGPEKRRPKRSRRGTRLLPLDRAMTDPPVPFPPGPRRRQNGCDVHLKFAAISRKHATLAVQEGGSVRPAARIFFLPPGPSLSRRDQTRDDGTVSDTHRRVHSPRVPSSTPRTRRWFLRT